MESLKSSLLMANFILRRSQIETIHSNLDIIVCWTKHLADGQDSRFGREEADGHLLGILHDGLGFYVECINVADPDRISPFEPETLKESAVIGNIYENKDSLPQVLGGCLGMILALFISLWLAGVVIQYGWNNIIAATFEIQRITFWQAVGIDLLITAITGNPKGDTEKSWLEVLGKVIYWYLVLWALMWIVVSLL